MDKIISNGGVSTSIDAIRLLLLLFRLPHTYRQARTSTDNRFIQTASYQSSDIYTTTEILGVIFHHLRVISVPNPFTVRKAFLSVSTRLSAHSTLRPFSFSDLCHHLPSFVYTVSVDKIQAAACCTNHSSSAKCCTNHDPFCKVLLTPIKIPSGAQRIVR